MEPGVMNDPHTLSFDTFWNWLMGHPNCILRAGTPEVVLYDDDDFHWFFPSEEPEALVVQVLRGKRLVGELVLAPDQVSYVQGLSGQQEGEYVFELISETETDRLAAYFFVMAHGYEPDVPSPHTPVH